MGKLRTMAYRSYYGQPAKVGEPQMLSIRNGSQIIHFGYTESKQHGNVFVNVIEDSEQEFIEVEFLFIPWHGSIQVDDHFEYTFVSLTNGSTAVLVKHPKGTHFGCCVDSQKSASSTGGYCGSVRLCGR